MQVHLDAMKDTHLHLACKGVATLTETIQEETPKMLFWKIRKVGIFLQNCPFIWKISIELFIGHGGCSKTRTNGDS